MDILLLNSGGIDSRVTACLLKEQGYKVHSFHVHFTKKTDEKVLPAAAKTAELYCEDHYLFEYPEDYTIDKANNINEVPYPPFSALILAAQYAKKKGYTSLASGIKAEGRRQKNFLQLFDEMLKQSLRDTSLEIIAPVYTKHFNEVIAIAKEKNVPLEDTYSCPNFPPCGQCFTCRKRLAINL